MLRPISNTAILTAAMLFALPGCSYIIANRGISGVREIPAELSRKEVQDRFGSPGSVGTTSLGRQVEIYHLRQKFKSPTARLLEGIPIPNSMEAAAIVLLLETVSFPMALAESEKNKLEVAFVYGPDDRVLYIYEPTAAPFSRYYQALRTLPHPLSSETELAKCPSAKDCMQRYAEERRKRAVELGHTLTNEDEDEEASGRDLQLAGNIDDGRMTKQAAIIRRTIYLLEIVFLKEIAEGKCPIVASCIEPDTLAVRRRAAEANYPLTPKEEKFFQLQLELAKDVDAGKITKEEMIKRARSHFTKLNIH